jgi:hypothetical protein
MLPALIKSLLGLRRCSGHAGYRRERTRGTLNRGGEGQKRDNGEEFVGIIDEY